MIINLKSPTDFSGFYIIYEGSTNIETPGIYGISHLMEHLVCKSFDDMMNDFDREGIDWNAYTSSNEIVFYFTGLDENLSKYRNEILHRMSKFDITQKQFENERQIVLEEYTDYFNDQSSSHMLNLSRKLFCDYDPIGLKSDLETLTLENCKDFFELQYSKPTKIINVSNKSKFKSNISFSNLSINRELVYGNHNVDFELSNDFKDKTSISILSPVIKDNFAHVKIINEMLGSGLQSPLYSEIREKKGLVYFVHTQMIRANKDGLTVISTQTSNKNVNKVIDCVKKVIVNPDKYLTNDRFNMIKDMHLIQKKKDKINRYSKVGKWIEPIEFSVNEYINNISFGDIRDVYDKYYKYNDFYISNDKDEFKK